MPASETVERDVHARCDAGDHDAAATLALRGYGPELYSFLAAIHGPADADDVFADVSARIWRGLPKFAWQSSLRTWAYTIARNASMTWRTKPRREVALDDASDVGKLAAEIRTATRTYLRTETKTKFAELRAALPLEDQELLILRVDRNLDWKELAQTLSDVDLDDAALTREAARLRKRFSLLKDKLLEAGRAAGLVGE